MIEKHEISDRIRGFILHRFPVARQRALHADDPLLESGIVDSISVMDVLVFIEEEFEVGVLNEELRPENFQTVASMAAFVQDKLQGHSDTQLEL